MIALFAVVGAITGLLLAGAGNAYASSAATGPIAILQEMETASPLVSESAVLRGAIGVIGAGLDPQSAKLVRYSDRASFGPSHSGTAWLARASARVPHGDADYDVDLSVLIDGNSGALIAAYTDEAPGWVAPAIAPQDPEKMASEVGWEWESVIPLGMQSTAADAIAAAWLDSGFDPRTVPQIIVRPRWVTPRFPANEVDGKLVPLEPRQIVWVVQVCGVKLNEFELDDGTDIYHTGKIMLFRDGTMKFVSAVFVQ